jgi:Ni,Fe-hydrogenase III large subunit
MHALSHRGRPIEAHRPYPRVVVDEETWRQATLGLAAGEATLLGLWSDGEAVHMCLTDASYAKIAVFSLAARERRFPSVGLTHPPALRLERTIRDLYGLEPEGLPDTRPWLDHGRWGVAEPLGLRRLIEATRAAYSFLRAEGPPLHQIPVGPVHAGIIEPGHFRFNANGEAVVRLEERLGYVHKGIEGLMIDAPLEKAAKLAARVSGDSTVAYSIAFARAVECALAIRVPPRAAALRAIMAELERLANHFGDIGAICNDASFSLLHAHCGALREQVLRTADICFGHRLMMDRVVPGGVAADISPRGIKSIEALLLLVRRTFPELVELYDNTASLQDRTVATGFLKGELARRYGAGGFVGRASGRSVDVRRNPGYEPYTQLKFDVPVREEGDVDARVWVRIAEVNESLGLLDQLLADLPDDAIMTDLDFPQGAKVNPEGLSLVEGFRGDVLAWVRMGERGSLARAHLRDPSWFQWPLLEAAIEGNIVADFPLCNKSFNCSYSGHDL